MPRNEPQRPLPEGIAALQPPQHAVRHFFTFGRMTVEVSYAFLIQRHGLCFANIVKQRNAAQQRFALHRLHRMERVFPHVVAMVIVFLIHTYHGQQFRPKNAQYIHKLPQDRHTVVAFQQLKQFYLNPLRRDICQQLAVSMNRSRCFRFYRKSKHRCKPQSPQDPQGIFVKAPIRFAHTAQTVLFQIRSAAKRIPQISAAVHGHSIDGKIPTAQILFQRRGKRHRIRPTMIAVAAIHPIGGDFHRAAGRTHADGTVL